MPGGVPHNHLLDAEPLHGGDEDGAPFNMALTGVPVASQSAGGTVAGTPLPFSALPDFSALRRQSPQQHGDFSALPGDFSALHDTTIQLANQMPVGLEAPSSTVPPSGRGPAPLAARPALAPGSRGPPPADGWEAHAGALHGGGARGAAPKRPRSTENGATARKGPGEGTGRRKGSSQPRRPSFTKLVIKQPWEQYQQARDLRQRRIRDSREQVKPQVTMLQTKLTPPDPANGRRQLAPFASAEEAREMLSQFEPIEQQQTRDPVFEATSKHSREEWQSKLEKKADLQRMNERLQSKWEHAIGRSQANAHSRDRLMLLALENSRLMHESAERKKLVEAEKKRFGKVRETAQKADCVVTLPIKCPAGVVPGQTLRVKCSGNRQSVRGKQFDVKVPDGVQVGQMFNVQFNIPGGGP